MKPQVRTVGDLDELRELMNWQPASEFDKRNNTWALIYIPAENREYGDPVLCAAYYEPNKNGWRTRGYEDFHVHALVSHFCILRTPDGKRMDELEEL